MPTTGTISTLPPRDCRDGLTAADQRDAAEADHRHIEGERRHQRADDDLGAHQPSPSTCSRPTVRPGLVEHGASRGHDARRRGGSVRHVVSDGQGLPDVAEQHLLVGDQPAGADAVHRHSVDLTAARADRVVPGGVGHRLHPGVGSSLRDQLCCAEGGARRRVNLGRMV